MARRQHRCDLCDAQRARWQRLCPFCYARLPHDLRRAIVDSWRRGDRRAWRAGVKAGLAHFAAAVARHMAARAAAAERTAAMLGERGDARA